MPANTLGAFLLLKNDVYKRVIVDEQKCGPVYDTVPNTPEVFFIHKDVFQSDFKKKSLNGYYYKIGKSAYLRDKVSVPGGQMVYCYRVDKRWAIGPDLNSRNVWMYSQITTEPPTGNIIWNENINGNSRKQLRDRAVSSAKSFITIEKFCRSIQTEILE